MSGSNEKPIEKLDEFTMGWEELEQAIDSLAESKVPSWNQMLDTMKNVPLWDNNVPKFDPSFNQRKPTISIINTSGENPRGAVIVCAGGAYRFKSVHEGKIVAERFQEAGFVSAVLDYRVMPYPPSISLLDAFRAIRLLRARAEEFNIIPDKIAILGFSAGGHLAGMAGTKFDYGNPKAEDPIEKVSSRPDAVIQCYGSITLASIWEKDRFMGTGNDIRKKIELSPDKNIRPDSPPFFLWQAADDNLVDARQMLHMAKELMDYHIPVEMHLFPKGGHGIGLADGSSEDTPRIPQVNQWVSLCINWLKEMGF